MNREEVIAALMREALEALEEYHQQEPKAARALADDLATKIYEAVGEGRQWPCPFCGE